MKLLYQISVILLLALVGLSLLRHPLNDYFGVPYCEAVDQHPPYQQIKTKTLLLAFFATAKEFERRSLIRSIVADRYDTDKVDVMFAIGQPETVQEKAIVELERRAYGDIFNVTMHENMNEGKTLRFFKDLLIRERSGELPKYQFVMKADTDSFVHMENLITRLRKLSTEYTYMGRPSTKDSHQGHPYPYMIGMGYILSWDLVELVATSEYAEQDKVGAEDRMMGRWVYYASLANSVKINYVRDFDAFFDHIKSKKWWYNQPFYASALVVHDLKQTIMYMHTSRHYYLSGGSSKR